MYGNHFGIAFLKTYRGSACSGHAALDHLVSHVGQLYFFRFGQILQKLLVVSQSKFLRPSAYTNVN